MPPTEATILSDFLLTSASLREVVSLKQFTEIFPKSHRSSPAIEELYQELHRLRQQDVEIVRQNIAAEIKRSNSLRRQTIQERRRTDQADVAGLDPVALDIENELSGQTGNKQVHTLQTIQPTLEEASEDIEIEIAEMEGDIQKALSEIKEVVDELSDLRFGKFSKSASGEDIGTEVLAALKMLEAACDEPAG